MIRSKQALNCLAVKCIAAVSIAVIAACSTNIARQHSVPLTNQVAGPAGRLHVDDGGAGGVPVVLVHSFAGSTAHWSRQLAHLRTTRRAVALDLRGHGQSDVPRSGGYAVPAQASDIAAVADALNLKRFVLVGHSMGGAAASGYALAHPDRVAGLVLVGAPGKTPPDQVSKIMSSLQADYDKVTEGYWRSLLTNAQPGVEAQVRSDMQRVPRDAGMAMIGAIFAYDPQPALRGYGGPTLIIDTPHGEGPGALHLLAPAVPRKVINGTSHWPHMDKPVEFNRLLDEFLATVR